LVKFLLEYAEMNNMKININVEDYAFRLACGSGNLDVVKFLLEYAEMNNMEIDINVQRDCVFRLACGDGSLELVKFLLEYAEMNNTEIDINADDEYAFRLACRSGNLELVKFLLSLSNDASFEVEENDSSFKNAEENNMEINTNADGDHAFQCACVSGNLELVKFLLEYAKMNNMEININADDEYVFRLACGSGNLELVKFLLEYAKINNTEININVDDNYAFRIACGSDNLELVKFLLFSINEFLNDISFGNELVEIDIHAGNDHAFRRCENEEIMNFLLLLLNQNGDEFYFRKENQYYIVKPLDFEMDLSRTKFEYFQIYHEETDYIDDCIEAYKLHLQRFRKKSTLSAN